MTTNRAPDVQIHCGRLLATVSPLNNAAKKWIIDNVGGNVYETGMYTIGVDYIDDTVEMFLKHGLVVEIK